MPDKDLAPPPSCKYVSKTACSHRLGIGLAQVCVRLPLLILAMFDEFVASSKEPHSGRELLRLHKLWFATSTREARG